MEGLMDEWIHSSNECIHLNLLRPSITPEDADSVFDEPFNPTFSYPIFENDETIIGYQEPKITLNFRANDLKPSLKVQYKRKEDFSTMLGDKKQTDVDTVFKDFLPASAFDPSEYAKSSVSDPTSSSWKPPGSLLSSFARDGKQFEIWSTSLADPASRELWRNMEILVLFYIEGASILELDEPWTNKRWTLHLLYEVTPLQDTSVSPYTLVGFSTTYRYWILPTLEVLRATKSLPSPPLSTNGDATPESIPRLELAPESTRETQLFTSTIDPLTVPSRERISQFLILPPYQGQSLGSKLYEAVFAHYHAQPNIFEIPVEDPSEAFDAMRDYSDISYLRTLPSFTSLSLASSLPPDSLRKTSPIPRDHILGNGADLKALRHESKIVPRQFDRMLELHLLSTIPPLHRNRARITRKERASNEYDRKYYFWRLALKDRIYRQNADVLDQVRKEDPEACVEKLEEAVDGQEQEYLERLERIGERGREERNGEGSGSAEGARRRLLQKRKRTVVEDEEDDWEDEDEDEEVQSVSSKRARK